MPTDITYNSLTATIPALGDAANIVTAFDSYHTDISAGVAVLARANTFTANIAINNGTSTELTTTGTTAGLFNTGATTLNVGGAATTLTIGATTGTATIRNATVAITNAATIGTTLAVTGNTTLTGDLAVNGGDLTSTSATFNLITSPSTVSLATSASTLTIGASASGTATIRNSTVAISNALTVGGTATLNGSVILGDAVGDTITVNGSTTFTENVVIGTGKTLIFEGATADAYETTLTVTDPTADRTVTLQNASGTVALLGTIALGTDTTGNYVASVATSSGLTGGAAGSEGAAISLGIDTGVVTTLTGSQTLTNKTLTSPIISTISNTGTLTLPTTTGTLALQPYTLVIASDVTDSISTTSSSTKTSAVFGKYVTASTNTAYKIDFAIHVYHSLVAPTANGAAEFILRFALPSGTIKSDFDYRLDTAAEDTESSLSSVYREISSSSTDILIIKSIASTSDNGYTVIKGSGIIRVGATGGSIGPTFYLSATNLGNTSSVSFTTAADSYCTIERIGTTGEINTGGWA